MSSVIKISHFFYVYLISVSHFKSPAFRIGLLSSLWY